MLADEITAELRDRRAQGLAAAKSSGAAIIVELSAKGIANGSITARPDGYVGASKVEGVDADLRVRPFFAHSGTVSIREFISGAINNEMGFQAVDMELTNAVANRSNTAVVEYLEFYLLNYFKPGLYEQTSAVQRGRQSFEQAGCASCHIPDLQIERDRRVADVETVYDAVRGHFNHLFATATPLFNTVDGRKAPKLEPFLVKDIYTDFKRHDLGPNFHKRNYDGTMQKQFLTAALWGVGSTAPYGHDGRTTNLHEVILWHGGEAQAARDHYAALGENARNDIQEFLRSLVLFPPDDTASNLDPGDRTAEGFPQKAHGSIKLGVLFNNPADPE